MCGIVGYLGTNKATPVLIDGLHRLEYRGYDSAGIATLSKKGLTVVKTKGRVDDLISEIDKLPKDQATIGIAHTRWATHGAPNKINAHPHISEDGRIVIVHNGIIENYATIRLELVKKGVHFKSQTDTEVLANLIANIRSEHSIPLYKAVQEALQLVRGAYSIAVIDSSDPDSLIVAKKGSPLAIGIGDNEFIIGSDATPIVAYTEDVVYINDGEAAELKRDGSYKVMSSLGKDINPEVQKLEIDLDKIEKNGYDHFMQKEIAEQPEAITNTLRGRLSLDNNTVLLGGIIDYEQRILRASKLIIVACGTSYHAGLVGKYLIEELAGIPVEVEYASEFRYLKSPTSDRDVVLAISQSGETADTLAALELAKQHNTLTLGLVNTVASSIARATDGGVYTHAGPEISVASTKAFTTQVTALTLMALRFAQQLGTIPTAELHKLYQQFAQLPTWVAEAVSSTTNSKDIAKLVVQKPYSIFLGRHSCYPVALEGALKLKEITYIPAEGFAAGEMKHGPIALIQKGTPVFVILPNNPQLKEKVTSNIEEVKARGAHIITIGTKEDAKLGDEHIVIPKVPDLFLPVVAAIPLQLLAYNTALLLNKDVDKPRNLAKSVTVE